MAILSHKEYPFPTFGFSGLDSYDKVSKEHDTILKLLEKESSKATLKNPIGFIVSFPVADGRAFYRVVNLKPLTLEFMPYGDEYRVSPFTIRGLRLSDIKRMISDRDWWTKRMKGKK